MKTLILDKAYQPISFVGFRGMANLLASEKVEVISTWPKTPPLHPFWGDMKHPATMRLKEYIRKRPRVPRFNRRAVFRRDHYTCCYTGKTLPPSQLTLDHVIPKDQGGKSTWENCVTASLEANSKKANRTPDQAGMKLLKKPTAPAHFLSLEYSTLRDIHDDWFQFFPELNR